MVSPARGAWRLLCLMVPAALSAQRPPAPPTVRLDRPVWRAREPLASLVGTRALSSGAVLVTDLSDVRLALPGDSTMLIDRDARRYLVISPAGAASRASSPSSLVLLGGGLALVAMAARRPRSELAKRSDRSPCGRLSLRP